MRGGRKNADTGEAVPDCEIPACKVHRGHTGAHVNHKGDMWFNDPDRGPENEIVTPEEWYETHPA